MGENRDSAEGKNPCSPFRRGVRLEMRGGGKAGASGSAAQRPGFY